MSSLWALPLVPIVMLTYWHNGSRRRFTPQCTRPPALCSVVDSGATLREWDGHRSEFSGSVTRGCVSPSMTSPRPVLNAAHSSAILHSTIDAPKVEDRTLGEAQEDLRSSRGCTAPELRLPRGRVLLTTCFTMPSEHEPSESVVSVRYALLDSRLVPWRTVANAAGCRGSPCCPRPA
jgi:hypothetical protein